MEKDPKIGRYSIATTSSTATIERERHDYLRPNISHHPTTSDRTTTRLLRHLPSLLPPLKPSGRDSVAQHERGTQEPMPEDDIDHGHPACARVVGEIQVVQQSVGEVPGRAAEVEDGC